jgi:hypothetical protein
VVLGRLSVVGRAVPPSTTAAMAGVRQRAVAAVRPVRGRQEQGDDNGGEQERTNGGEASHGTAAV